MAGVLTGAVIFSAVSLSGAVGSSPSAGADSPPCNADQSISATPDTALDNLFDNYGNAGQGHTWTGGDGTESVALPNGSELWLFDDSVLGKVTGGTRDFAKTPFLHNSFVLETNGALTKTLYNSRTQPPTAYLSPKRAHPFPYAFWPGASVVNGNTLDVIGGVEKFTKIGDSTHIGEDLAIFKLPSLKRLRLEPLSRAQALVGWNGGVPLSSGGYTYLYGYGADGIYAARVAGTDLTSPWTYYDGSGWTSDESAATPILDLNPLSHFSVSYVGGAYLFIARATVVSNEIVGALGCSPVGPFGPLEDVYYTPEPDQYPGNLGVVTYGAHAHPELSTGPDSVIVSYDVNPKGPQQLDTPDASIYRPRFITVTLTP